MGITLRCQWILYRLYAIGMICAPMFFVNFTGLHCKKARYVSCSCSSCYSVLIFLCFGWWVVCRKCIVSSFLWEKYTNLIEIATRHEVDIGLGEPWAWLLPHEWLGHQRCYSTSLHTGKIARSAVNNCRNSVVHTHDSLRRHYWATFEAKMHVFLCHLFPKQRQCKIESLE